MTDINATLAERGNRYGAFRDHAFIAQNLKKVMWGTPGWQRLEDDQKQALEVIADKIARILNGDPQYVDNWHDICGYSKLVEDRLAGMQPLPDGAVNIPPLPGESLEQYGTRVKLATIHEAAMASDEAWENLMVPGADEPQSQIVHQRSKIRRVIDDFWKNRSTVE